MRRSIWGGMVVSMFLFGMIRGSGVLHADERHNDSCWFSASGLSLCYMCVHNRGFKSYRFQQLMLIRCGDSWRYCDLLQSMRKRKRKRKKKTKTKTKKNNTNPLMKMQKLRKPRHGHILRPLKASPLIDIALIAPDAEPVHHAREELIVIWDVQGRDYAVYVGLQLGSQHRVVLRGDDLHGDGDGVDFFLGQKRGVGG